uniref:40S ribosomal protein S5 n=1 Tax=Oryza meridionalis TaxID=40149 RepID=A0A0E0DXB5_9ORYZ
MAEVELSQQEVKLFSRWSFEDVQVKDLSLADYLAVNSTKHAAYLPHTAGSRYSAKRFRKAQCPIVELLMTNSLMMLRPQQRREELSWPCASSTTPRRSSTSSPTPTPYRSSSTPSSTAALVRMRPVLVMFKPFGPGVQVVLMFE